MRLLLFLFPFLLLAQPTYKDISIYKGDYTVLTFEVLGDVTSDSLTFGVKASRDDDDPRVIQKTTSNMTVSYSNTSSIKIPLYSTDTEGLTAAVYYYDLEIDSVTYWSGSLSIVDEVSGTADGIATKTPYYHVALDTPSYSPSFLIGQDSDNGWDVVSKTQMQDSLGLTPLLDSNYVSLSADSFIVNSGGMIYSNQTTGTDTNLFMTNNSSTGQNAYFEQKRMDTDNFEVKGGRTDVDRIFGQEPVNRYFVNNREDYDDRVLIQAGEFLGRDHYGFGDIAMDGDTLWTIYRASPYHGIDVDSSQLWMEYSVDEGLTWGGRFVSMDSSSTGGATIPSDLREPNITFLSDDSLMLVTSYENETDSTRSISTWKSGDKGRNWAAGVNVVTATQEIYQAIDRVHEFPDHRLGFLYLRKSGIRPNVTSSPDGDTTEIWYAFSDDMGATWDTNLVHREISSDFWMSEPTMVVYPEASTTQRAYGTCRIYDRTIDGTGHPSGKQYEFFTNDGGDTWNVRQTWQNYIKNDPAMILCLANDRIILSHRDSTGQPQRIYFSEQITENTSYPTWQTSGSLKYAEIDLTYGYSAMINLGGGRIGTCYMRQSSVNVAYWYYQILDLNPERFQLENSRLKVGEVYPTVNYAISKLSEYAGQITLSAATSDTVYVPGLVPTDMVFLTQQGSSPVSVYISAEPLHNFLVIHASGSTTATFNYWILRQR